MTVSDPSLQNRGDVWLTQRYSLRHVCGKDGAVTPKITNTSLVTLNQLPHNCSRRVVLHQLKVPWPPLAKKEKDFTWHRISGHVSHSGNF